MTTTPESVEALGRLADVARELRDRVNFKRRVHALVRNLARWNTTCSAMDVVGDTCWALGAYLSRKPIAKDDKGPAYLLAYGILHSLYLQQDAVFWWCKSLDVKPVADFTDPGQWALSIPELARARNARNDSTGHPVRRDRPKQAPLAAFFISQHTLTDKGFELRGYDERGGRAIRHVSFAILITDQVRVVTAILEDACDWLDAEDSRHHERFMHKPLTPILNRLDYPIQKLGGKGSTPPEFVVQMCDEILDRLAELKAALAERDEPFDEMWKWEYRKLTRALTLMKDYMGPNTSQTDDDLADVLADFVRCSISEMREWTEELDARYAESGSPAASGVEPSS